MKNVEVNIRNIHQKQLLEIIDKAKKENLPIQINIESLFMVTDKEVLQREINKEFIIGGENGSR